MNEEKKTLESVCHLRELVNSKARFWKSTNLLNTYSEMFSTKSVDVWIDKLILFIPTYTNLLTLHLLKKVPKSYEMHKVQ